MKRLIGIVVFISIVAAHSGAFAELAITTGLRVNRVSDDLENNTEGTEYTIPFSVRYLKGERFSLRIDTGYGLASVTQTGKADAELVNLTDTLISANYSIPGLPAIVSVGLNLNLPTGKARLSPKERNATIGENNDLFETEKFGEGVNVGVNLSVLKKLGTVLLGVNGLYVYKGEYDPTSDIERDAVDPGDQFLAAGLAGWQISSAFTMMTMATYSYFTEDQVQGTSSYQEGGTLTIGGSLNYGKKPVGVSVSIQQVLPQKDKELVNSTLTTETENSGSKTFNAALTIMYICSPSLTLQAFGDMRLYTESDRRELDHGLPFAGKRTRYSVGPGVTYTLNPHLSLFGLLKYVRLTEQKDVYLSDDRIFTGINAQIGITYLF